MISSANMGYINAAINSYDRLVGKTYLVAYGTGKAQSLHFVEIQISEKNFWHLAGCRFSTSVVLTGKQKACLYAECLNGSDISQYLDYTDRPGDVQIKCDVVRQIFDFVKNAKMLRLTDTVGVPEETMFCIGIGTMHGLVGYIKNKHLYMPKTVQAKSIYLKNNVNGKIYIILSRPSEETVYDTLEYEAASGLFLRMQSELSASPYRLSVPVPALH